MLRHAQQVHAVARHNDGDAVVGAEAAEIAITRHDEVGAASDGTCEDARVIGVTDGVKPGQSMFDTSSDLRRLAIFSRKSY